MTREAYAIIVLGLIALYALWTHFRRWNEMRGWWAFIVVLISVGACHALFPFVQAWLGALPEHTQAMIRERGQLVSFLFWFAAFATIGYSGLGGLVLSSAVFDGSEKPSPLLRRIIPFVAEYWALTEKPSQLHGFNRSLVFVHHAVFSIAVLCVGGTGLLMTFGFPTYPLWLYLAAGIAAALLLNPARSDRRRLARLAAVEQDAALNHPRLKSGADARYT